MWKQTILALAAWAVLVGAPHPASAALLADLTSAGSIDAPELDFTGGWSFTVDSPIQINGLGFWDEGGDGLVASHDVGLWTDAGALLTSATVTNASTPVASDLNTGRWLIADVTTLDLSPGTYVVGALLFQDGDPDYFSETGAAFIPEVTFVEQRQSVGGTLQYPGVVLDEEGDTGYFGATLRTVPEPSALVIGLIALLVGCSFRIKQRLG